MNSKNAQQRWQKAASRLKNQREELKQQGNYIQKLTDKIQLQERSMGQLISFLPQDMWAIVLTKVDLDVGIYLKSRFRFQVDRVS